MRSYLLLLGSLWAQNVGIGTGNPTHRLHLANLSATDQGLLRVEALAHPNQSLGTFSTTGVLGYIPFTGSGLDLLRGDLTFAPDNTDWRLLGNTGTNASLHFLGTTDAQPLIFRTSNTERMRILATGEVWIGTTTPLSPSNNRLNILSGSGSADRALTARSDTIALYGVATSTVGPGIVGYLLPTAANGIAFFARGNNLATFPTVIPFAGFVAQGTVRGLMGAASSTSATPRMGGYFSNQAATTFSRVACRDGTTNYKVLGTGTVNTVVEDGTGQAYLLTAPEAPLFLIQDFGEAQLTEGTAYLTIDPRLLEQIDVENLSVWLTPLGPCAGLYPEKDPTGKGFYVRERESGRSHVRFMWAWSAPLKGSLRFPLVSPPPSPVTSQP